MVVERGMVCAVLFTLNFYKTTPKDGIATRIIKKTAGFNLQSIVILDDANPYTADLIGDFVGPSSPDVEVDRSLALERAINPQAVAQAPRAVFDPDEPLM